MTIKNMVNFGGDTDSAMIALCAAMTAIVIWAIGAWAFGIPTSFSKAQVAARRHSVSCSRRYVENMHRLYGESDLRTVVVWKNIYACIENCMDVCEHAADIVNTVIMKNS